MQLKIVEERDELSVVEELDEEDVFEAKVEKRMKVEKHFLVGNFNKNTSTMDKLPIIIKKPEEPEK
jgi:hypothetical protein